ncbi:MAG: hypothetical protein M1816_000653 [Peltula sp. TS41687]|nr:MAG: hypothetical protein M1816_000653 [Peltula sp. TS41687]
MSTPLSPLSAANLNAKSPSKSIPKSDSGKPWTSMDEPLTSVTPIDVPLPPSSSSGDEDEQQQQQQQQQPLSTMFDANTRGQQDLFDIGNDVRTPLPSKSSPAKNMTSPTRDSTPLRFNEGLTRVLQTLEVDVNLDDQDEGDSFTTVGAESVNGDIDDTAFSTFSAVPNAEMTLFVRSSQGFGSPAKGLGMDRHQSGLQNLLDDDDDEPHTPATARPIRHGGLTSSPATPHGRYETEHDNDTTNLILDFTEQFNALTAPSSNYPRLSPNKRGRPGPTKSQTQPNLALHLAASRAPSPSKNGLPATPSRRTNLASLLDFDIPPAPTPRSIPSVSARELESLKSSYLSQISSLKAALSGREAEIKSFMDAVADAERRVGEVKEAVREERAAKEALQADKDNWERRGKDVEAVLCEVKDELNRSEEEKTAKLAEAERRCEEAESRAAQAESQLASRKAEASPTKNKGPSQEPNKEVEAAVSKVARELHALYKSKHETKVTALKKSYATQWEKKVKELERKLDEANKQLEKLRSAKDANMSGVILTDSHSQTIDDQTDADTSAAAACHLQYEEQKAKVAGLTEELMNVKRDNDNLIRALEIERVERGDLVAAVEEMLELQGAASAGDVDAAGELECIRGSISRASGRSMASSSISAVHQGRPESRVGRATSIPTPGQSRSLSSGSLGTLGKSGIMSNIERMGKGRGE